MLSRAVDVNEGARESTPDGNGPCNSWLHCITLKRLEFVLWNGFDLLVIGNSEFYLDKIVGLVSEPASTRRTPG
jgi:hypothetical protein